MHRTAAYALGLTLAAASPAIAVPIAGSYWDAPSAFATIDDAIAFAQSNAATATFTSGAIDYPDFSGLPFSAALTLEDFLGVDAPSIVGDGTRSFETSVIRLSGIIDVTPGDYTVSVGADDGHRLSFGAAVISESNVAQFNSASDIDVTLAGPTSFELYFVENMGFTGLVFDLNGTPLNENQVVQPVPLPASMGFLGLALLTLGAAGRRKG